MLFFSVASKKKNKYTLLDNSGYCQGMRQGVPAKWAAISLNYTSGSNRIAPPWQLERTFVHPLLGGVVRHGRCGKTSREKKKKGGPQDGEENESRVSHNYPSKERSKESSFRFRAKIATCLFAAFPTVLPNCPGTKKGGVGLEFKRDLLSKKDN